MNPTRMVVVMLSISMLSLELAASIPLQVREAWLASFINEFSATFKQEYSELSDEEKSALESQARGFIFQDGDFDEFATAEFQQEFRHRYPHAALPQIMRTAFDTDFGREKIEEQFPVILASIVAKNPEAQAELDALSPREREDLPRKIYYEARMTRLHAMVQIYIPVFVIHLVGEYYAQQEK